MPTQLDPSQIANYAAQRGRLQTTYGSNTAMLNWQRQNTVRDHDLNWAEQTQKWDQGAAQIPGAFSQRGMLGSGMMKRAKRQFTQSRQSEFGQLANQYNDAKSGYDMQQTNYNNAYWNDMQDSGNQEYMARAGIAANLRGETR